MKVGRLTSWIFCASIVAALPVIGSTTSAAASPTTSSAHRETICTRSSPSLQRQRRPAPSLVVTGSSKAPLSPSGSTQWERSRSHGRRQLAVDPRLSISTQTDTLVAPFLGPSQAQDINAHGADQDVTPPDTDVAVGPSNVVATVNSTIDVYSRAGGVPVTDDLNTFLSIGGVLSSTDPRIVYDASSARWWLTDTEAQSFNCGALAAPVLVAVSASSNPLPIQQLDRVHTAVRPRG